MLPGNGQPNTATPEYAAQARDHFELNTTEKKQVQETLSALCLRLPKGGAQTYTSVTSPPPGRRESIAGDTGDPYRLGTARGTCTATCLTHHELPVANLRGPGPKAEGKKSFPPRPMHLLRASH